MEFFFAPFSLFDIHIRLINYNLDVVAKNIVHKEIWITSVQA